MRYLWTVEHRGELNHMNRRSLTRYERVFFWVIMFYSRLGNPRLARDIKETLSREWISSSILATVRFELKLGSSEAITGDFVHPPSSDL